MSFNFKKYLWILSLFMLVSCGGGGNDDIVPTPPINPPTTGGNGGGGDVNPASIGITGDKADVKTTTSFGYVIMGGGADVDNAFVWMMERAGGGDVVIIRATGTAAYNDYIFGLGKVNSVETLLINSRDLANNDKVVNTIRNAEMLFIAGGDQSDYVNFWKGTKTQDAINYLINEKKVPVGGTSAGAAILGGIYFSAMNGSVTSADALANPMANSITLGNNDFIHPPAYMKNMITDQHFTARDRQGRLMVFLARAMTTWGLAPTGVGVDESTAVCVNDQGIATIYGTDSAYFLKSNSTMAPERIETGKSLNWVQNNQAVSAYVIKGNRFGKGSFDMKTFDESTATEGTSYWWWVENGVFKTKDK